MGTGWAIVPLGEVMRPALDPHIVDPVSSYPIAGVYGFGRGMIKRPPTTGQEIAATQLFRIRSGQFIYSRLKSFEGAFAIVSDDVDGFYVSNEFPTFDTKPGQLDPAYLGWYFKQKRVWQALASDNKGIGARRERLHPDRLLAHEIPLPPLDEQRRIVARIDDLAAKIVDARGIRQEVAKDVDAVFNVALDQLINKPSVAWTEATVEHIAASIDAGWSPQCNAVSAAPEEWGVLKTTAVQWCSFQAHENKRIPDSLIPRFELTLKCGDVLVTRAGPMKRVGVPATVREDHPKLMISDKLIRIRPRLEFIDARFLEYALASPLAQEHLVARKTGLADAQVNISQSILRSTPIAFPDLEEQRCIVAELDTLQAKVDAVTRLQTETATELDALLPALLDRAFKGEL